MTRITAAASATCAALALLAAPVHAHLIESGLGPVYDGVAHFALTAQDAAPTLALGLFAGLRGADHGRRAMFALPSSWFLGGCLGMVAGSLADNFTLGAQAAWLPLLLLGGLVAADVRVSNTITTALAIVLGLLLGLENGIALGPTGGLPGLVGIVACVFAVVTLTAAWVASCDGRVARTAARVVGSWIAASGMLLLGWSLR
jgi:hydrogenase/urease accessory protein HupE